MPKDDERREEEIREVLMDAVEVELAALKAAVSFWREWAEQTSKYVKTASKTLSTIRSEDKDASQVLLEVVDASRETLRTMTELPRNAAERFIQELDQLEEKKKARVTKPTPAKEPEARESAKKTKAKPAPKRRARVKP